jgi:hypothetical protein
MPEDNCSLGICFYGSQLFYAVCDAEKKPFLSRLGAVNFNFDIVQALINPNESYIEGLRETLNDLTDRFGVRNVQLLLHPAMECWATVPKLVYDDAEERKAYINILMNGRPRKHIHPAWYTLSNEKFKLLRLRTTRSLTGINRLTEGFAGVGLSSTFEIGERWIEHIKPGGSFLTVSVFDHCISVSSFILGKLRGATYIAFDELHDLPYLWLQRARDLQWMQGLHEQIQVYGHLAHRIIDTLEPFWDEAGTVTKMDTLEDMQVHAEEETYSFDLSLAYPAVLLALG